MTNTFISHAHRLVKNICIAFVFIVTLMLTSLALAQSAYRHSVDCWLEKKSSYGVSFTGTEAGLADIHNEIRRLSSLYKVPVEIVGVVAHQESIGLYHYGSDGFVVHNPTECRYAFSNGGVISLAGGAPPPGLGLMQLTGATASGSGNIGRLITDWRFNLEQGVKVLVNKYNTALSSDPTWMQQLERENMNVLENWFYALRFYNGYRANDLTYLNAIYGKVASLPSNGRLNGLFSPVTITKPASVIANWNDGNSFVALPNNQWQDKNGTVYAGSVHVSGATPASGNPPSFRLLAGTGSGGSNPFSLVELQTNPVKEVPVISNTRYFVALDTAPDGRLYGANDDLYLINPVSGTVTTIGTIHTSGNSPISVRSIAFSPEGTLYATGDDIDPSSSFLYTINTATAVGRRIGPITGGAVWGIDFAPDGRLYGALLSLYLLDRSTGRVISEVGQLPGDGVLEIDFAGDGFIYGVRYDTGTLYRINPNTAASTPIGIYQADLWGIASQPRSGPTVASPSIVTQPTSQSVLPGANVTLSVVANGTAPLSYQWRFNGSALAGATSSTLALNNVSATQAGMYSVVVANTSGSVTSTNATLAIGVTLSFRLLAGTGSEGVNPFGLVELQTNPAREIPVISKTRYFPALDMAPDGRLYGASLSLYLIDPVGGTVTTIGSIQTSSGDFVFPDSIAFSPEGILYAKGFDSVTLTDSLWTVDPTTSIARRLGPITGGFVWGIDFAPDGRLYGANFSLYLLDRNTGRIISEIGQLPGGGVVDIDFASDGYIYGVRYDTGTLYRINPNTAASTPIGIYQSDLWGIASQPLSNLSPTKAALTDPVPGSALASATATFSWSGGSGVSDYVLYAGKSAGGKEYYSQDRGLNRTATVSNLPTDGSTIYVTLWSLIAGNWQSSEATYITFKAPIAKGVLTDPVPGSALASSSVIFSWSGGTGVSDYVLYVGKLAGGKEYYSQDRGLNRTATVQNLPTDGSTIYVTLWSLIAGNWQSNEAIYITFKAPVAITKAALTDPVPGSALVSATTIFSWSIGTGVSDYVLNVGKLTGGKEYYSQDRGLNRTATVQNLPTDGSTLYVTLWSLVAGKWESSDASYTAFKATPVQVNLSVTKPTISGSSAGAPDRLFTGEITLRAAILNESSQTLPKFSYVWQFSVPAQNRVWADFVRFDIPSLAAGASANVEYKWTAEGPGEWEFRLVADSGNAIAESNEEDNYSQPIRVSIVDRKGVATRLTSDGDSDILFQDDSGFLAVWAVQGLNVKSGSLLIPDHVEDTASRVVGTGDFNRDAKADILFQKADGTLNVWYMNGALKRTSQATLNPSRPGGGDWWKWCIAGTGDMDKDGQIDVIFQHIDGTIAVWFMDGAVRRSEATITIGSSPDPAWHVLAVSDLDGDGNADFVVQKQDSTLALWKMDGAKFISASPLETSKADAGWYIVGAGDKNGDGKADLLMQHNNRDLGVWFMNGAKRTSAQAFNPFNPGGTWSVASPLVHPSVLNRPRNGFLSFPLTGKSPYSTRIVAIFDNDKEKGSVKAYNGEVGSVDEKCYPSPENCEVRGYRKQDRKPFTLTLLNYDDEISGLKEYLFYDGHNGYDYAYSGIKGEPIYPAAPGVLVVATATIQKNGKDLWRNESVAGSVPGGPVALQWEKYHAFYIIHARGYSTWYLHASDFEPTIKAKLVEDGYASVTTDMPIAYVGDVGVEKRNHLHFGVRLGDVLIDPYGDGSGDAILWSTPTP